MITNLDRDKLIDELTNFVQNSSNAENLIVSTFIAGMQAKKILVLSEDFKEK